MNEPEYNYIKGKGWCLNEYEQLDVTFRNGRKAKIVNRPPNVGELYTYIGQGSIAAKKYGDNFEGHCRWLNETNWVFEGTPIVSLEHHHIYTVIFCE